MAKLHKYKNHRGMYYFNCPACNSEHYIATAENDCGFPIWQWNKDVNNPTISPSIQEEYHGDDKDTICHSFIRDGKIQYLSDCTHQLAGQTVELPDTIDEYDEEPLKE